MTNATRMLTPVKHRRSRSQIAFTLEIAPRLVPGLPSLVGCIHHRETIHPSKNSTTPSQLISDLLLPVVVCIRRDAGTSAGSAPQPFMTICARNLHILVAQTMRTILLPLQRWYYHILDTGFSRLPWRSD